MQKKTHPNSEPLLIRLLAGVFINTPLGFAGMVLTSLAKVKVSWIRNLVFGALVVVSVLAAICLKQFLDYLQLLFLNETRTPAVEAAIKFSLFYLMYLIISLPVFIAISYLNTRSKLFKAEAVRRESTREHMWRQRLKSTYYQTYLGESLERNKSLFLTNDQREMHMQVVGSTGTGKTESVLLPMLAHDIRLGKGALVIDGKGDRELLDRIHHIVKGCGRRTDFTM